MLLGLREEGIRKGNIFSFSKHGKTRHNFKAMGGRGRKRARWVEILYEELIQEYCRLSSASVKTSPSLLRTIAIHLLEKCEPDSELKALILLERVSPPLRITDRWLQYFMMHYDLVIRRQTENLGPSPKKRRHIHRSVAYHLGKLKRGFESGELDEEEMENAHETHFVFNMENSRAIGFRGTENIKYADVVSGDEGITMMVRIRGGKNAYIESPFLVFKNDRNSYPIRGVPDNVPVVCHRSQKHCKRVFYENQ